MQSSARLPNPALGHPQTLALPSATLGTAAFCVVCMAAFAAVLLRRWVQIGAYATGIDVGNWFAFGRGALGGVGPSGGGAYPPLVPALLFLGRGLVGAMPAAKLIGVGSAGAVMLATFAVASRGMSRWLALVTAITVGSASAITEPTAFGGYPQNYAIAFLLVAALALALTVDALLAGGPLPHRAPAAAAGALAGAALCHHAYFALACLVATISWLLFVAARPSRRTLVRGTALFLAVGAPGVLCFLPTYLALRAAGYSAPIDASHLSIESALRYAIVDAPWLWIPILSTGIAYALFAPRVRGRPAARVAAALLLASMVFLVTNESRILPLLIIGATVSTGLALDELRSHAAGTRWAALPVAAAVAFIVVLFPMADARAASLYSYYRTADRSLMNATAWIDAHRVEGSVAVRQDGRGWPLGWWFEGLTRADIVVGSNLQWLAFPREHERSALANRLFDDRLSADDVRSAASAAGVRYLVLRKWDWTGWQHWTSSPIRPITVAFDDGEFLILDVT